MPFQLACSSPPRAEHDIIYKKQKHLMHHNAAMWALSRSHTGWAQKGETTNSRSTDFEFFSPEDSVVNWQ